MLKNVNEDGLIKYETNFTIYHLFNLANIQEKKIKKLSKSHKILFTKRKPNDIQKLSNSKYKISSRKVTFKQIIRDVSADDELNCVS